MNKFMKGFTDFYFTFLRWGYYMFTPYDPYMEVSADYVNIHSKMWSTINYYNHLRGGWEKYPAWDRFDWDEYNEYDEYDE